LTDFYNSPTHSAGNLQ